MYYGHCPHRASEETQPADDGIGQPFEGDLVRTAGVIRSVGLRLDPLVPVVAIAIEIAYAVTVHANVVSREDKGGGLVLVSDR